MLTAQQIEAMRDKVKTGKGQLILMQQNPANYHYWTKANYHYWTKSVTAAEQDEWLELLDLAAMAARIRER